MAKVLFFFTSCYPYGTGETFIENEIEYLAEAFDKVVIASNDMVNDQTRTISTNTLLYRLGYELSTAQKILAYRNIFTKLFWQEIAIIKNTYKQKLTKGIINTMCQTLQKSCYWKPIISAIIQKESKVTDQIYLYSYWNNDMACAIASYKQTKNKVKAFSRMHRWDVYFEESSINYLPFRKYIFKTLNCVFSISEDGIQYTENKLNENFKTIKLSRLGVQEQKIQNPPNKGIFHILSISNLIPIKQIDLIIRALYQLNFEFIWTHIGDGPILNELQKLAEQKITGKYEFKGSMKNKEVLNYLATIPVDLFINMSLSEGIPVSIMEAMSFGIPVMATAVGGTPEIVENENGMLLSPNPTPSAIANQIIKFYNLTAKEKEIKRETAYQRWRLKFSAEKNYRDFTKLLQEQA